MVFGFGGKSDKNPNPDNPGSPASPGPRDLAPHARESLVAKVLLPGETVEVLSNGKWVLDVVQGLDRVSGFYHLQTLGEQDPANIRACESSNPSSGLPVGWESAETSDGKIYYYSRATAERTWNAPKVPPIQDLIDKIKAAGVIVKVQPQNKDVSSDFKYKTRDGTKSKIAKELGMKSFDSGDCRNRPPFLEKTVLFKDSAESSHGSKGQFKAEGNYLLGRFDTLAVLATADFDQNWKFIKGGVEKKPFWCLHAAAINIGESPPPTGKLAEDFKDYEGPPGQLDENAYIRDMGIVYENILTSAQLLKATDILWFPFGMGAFLRNLANIDGKYQTGNKGGLKQIELRHNIATRFVEALVSSGICQTTKIHLCVTPADKLPVDEGDMNAAGFVKAFLQAVSAKKIPSSAVELNLNADVLPLAQQLAEAGRTVALVNGANRSLIGNHWFSRGAMRAIDENMHRRSWRMAAISYVLNGGKEVKSRQPNELSHRVQKYGGKVYMLNDNRGARGYKEAN